MLNQNLGIVFITMVIIGVIIGLLVRTNPLVVVIFCVLLGLFSESISKMIGYTNHLDRITTVMLAFMIITISGCGIMFCAYETLGKSKKGEFKVTDVKDAEAKIALAKAEVGIKECPDDYFDD